MALGDVFAFLQSDWVALWAATLHNSMYGNVPGLFSPYKIGLDGLTTFNAMFFFNVFLCFLTSL